MKVPIRTTGRTFGIVSILIASLFASVALARPLGVRDAGSGRFELSDDPGQIVIRLTETIGQVRSEDMPSITIYADGRVVRHRAEWMSHPGDYTATIDASELARLVTSLESHGILNFDAASTRRDVRAAERRQKTLFQASDESRFTIEVNLDAYQPPGKLVREKNVRKAADWTGLRADARRFPEIRSIQGFAAAFRELEALAARVEHDAGLARP